MFTWSLKHEEHVTGANEQEVVIFEAKIDRSRHRSINPNSPKKP